MNERLKGLAGYCNFYAGKVFFFHFMVKIIPEI